MWGVKYHNSSILRLSMQLWQNIAIIAHPLELLSTLLQFWIKKHKKERKKESGTIGTTLISCRNCLRLHKGQPWLLLNPCIIAF